MCCDAYCGARQLSTIPVQCVRQLRGHRCAVLVIHQHCRWLQRVLCRWLFPNTLPNARDGDAAPRSKDESSWPLRRANNPPCAHLRPNMRAGMHR